jgi:hypothetical protein
MDDDRLVIETEKKNFYFNIYRVIFSYFLKDNFLYIVLCHFKKKQLFEN